MASANPQPLSYRRSHFSTQLPLDYRYTPAHSWLAALEPGVWRIGLTKFATRMLGEMVDHGFETKPGASVQSGEILGWIEGFKAISDIYCPATGEFLEANPELERKITWVNRDPYGRGWLYAVRGEPDATTLDVYAYRDLLDRTIDRILAKQQEDAKSDGEKPG